MSKGRAKDIVLIIGAHHEEVEAEFPNTAAKLADKCARVVILNPVGGWNWSFIRGLGADGAKRTILEAQRAAKELGCEKVIWDYPVAELEAHKLEIMRRMADFILDLNPSIVLTHWPLDSHADHRLIAKISRHVLNVAPNLVENFKRGLNVKEIYAFQAGITQTYNYTPDFLALADADSMRKAEKALRCFHGSARQRARVWWENVQCKTNSWKQFTGGVPAEPLKFVGPQLPLRGFRLAEILGDDIVSMPFDRWFCDSDGQI
jgi:LmbE family N-acetylglucosaminyl deacetylase